MNFRFEFHGLKAILYRIDYVESVPNAQNRLVRIESMQDPVRRQRGDGDHRTCSLYLAHKASVSLKGKESLGMRFRPSRAVMSSEAPPSIKGRASSCTLGSTLRWSEASANFMGRITSDEKRSEHEICSMLLEGPDSSVRAGIYMNYTDSTMTLPYCMTGNKRNTKRALFGVQCQTAIRTRSRVST